MGMGSDFLGTRPSAALALVLLRVAIVESLLLTYRLCWGYC